MNRTERFSNRLLISLFALILSGSIVAQEQRTIIDMLGGGSTIYGLYHDFDPISDTEWGWKEMPVYDDLRISERTDRNEVDPHAGFLAFPVDRNHSYRLATKTYGDDQGTFQTAAGGRIYYEYDVTDQNAIALLDYAAMLEYAGHQMPHKDVAEWQYYQPWVRMYVAVFNPQTNQWDPQSPTFITHAWDIPAEAQATAEGWKKPNKADGWLEGDVDLYDVATNQFLRTMHLFVKDWTRVGLDLRGCIGYKVRIMAEYHDCAVSSENATWDNYYTYQYNFCEDHHVARLYTTLVCTQPLLQKEGETCEPASAVTYSAPEGFTYRWYTATNPGVTVSTDRVCTYQFAYSGEQTTLFCEMQSPSSMSPTTLSVDISDNCVVEATFEFPTYVCADAPTMDITFNYTSGSPKSYDIIFDDNALANGFVNLTDQPILQGSNTIAVPMPPSSTTQYARPNFYSYTLRVHQSNGTDAVYTQILEVRYPAWLISQRWDDMLGLLNQNYNGGYIFSGIQWYQDGAPAYSAAPYPSYIYQPGGLNPASEYWAVLTRTLDGVSLCTCPVRPVIQQYAPEKSPERIQLTADNADRRIVRVNTDLSGTYTLYNIDGKVLNHGCFGEEYGSPVIQLPAAGAYIIRFRDNEQGEETKKWIAE